MCLNMVYMLQNKYIHWNQYPGKGKNGKKKEKSFHQQDTEKISRVQYIDNLESQSQHTHCVAPAAAGNYKEDRSLFFNITAGMEPDRKSRKQQSVPLPG